MLGLTASLNASRTTFTISGTPLMNVTQTTVYDYQIETIGSNCSSEVTLTGSLTIIPQDSVALISEPLTDNQTVCLNNNDNPSNSMAAPIEPIEYQLYGGAVGEPVTIRYSSSGGSFVSGLPAGLGSTITASNTVRFRWYDTSTIRDTYYDLYI